MTERYPTYPESNWLMGAVLCCISAAVALVMLLSAVSFWLKMMEGV